MITVMNKMDVWRSEFKVVSLHLTTLVDVDISAYIKIRKTLKHNTRFESEDHDKTYKKITQCVTMIRKYFVVILQIQKCQLNYTTFVRNY